MVDYPPNHASDLSNQENKHHILFDANGMVIVSDGEKWHTSSPPGEIIVDFRDGFLDGATLDGDTITPSEYATPDNTLDGSWTSGSPATDGSHIDWWFARDVVIKYYNIYKCTEFSWKELELSGGGDIARSGSPGLVITSGSPSEAFIYGADIKIAPYGGSYINISDLRYSSSRYYLTNIGLIYSPVESWHLSVDYSLKLMTNTIRMSYDSSGSAGCQVSLSFDSGDTWSEFVDCLNGEFVPGLVGMDLSDALIQIKTIVYCEPETCIMGTVSNVRLISMNPHVDTHVNGGDDIVCYVGDTEPGDPFPGMMWWDTST